MAVKISGCILRLLQIDLGLRDGRQVSSRTARGSTRARPREELLITTVLTHLGVEDPPRHFPFAEAGDLDLVRDRPVRPIEILGELLGIDLDRQLDGVLLGRSTVVCMDGESVAEIPASDPRPAAHGGG